MSDSQKRNSGAPCFECKEIFQIFVRLGPLAENGRRWSLASARLLLILMSVMTWDHPADRAIDRFYELQDIDPRNCQHGIMLVGNVLYRVTIDSISRSGKTVYFHCNGEPGSARRDNIGEWLTEGEPHYPIRFVAAERQSRAEE